MNEPAPIQPGATAPTFSYTFRRKCQLPFALASDDAGHGIASAFATRGRKQFMGKTCTGQHRMAFPVRPDGRIRPTFARVNPDTHAEAVLEIFRSPA
jgi:peroxiredoxin